ncbi:haloacid dehalogenase-like hydrolase [Galbibacter sp. PAP.153]|uniref:HAD family hydrolase n=1 Tax=Galbibacter sp. PAP.153 TaxID=3104623 RepID=UPI00300A97AA
MKSRKTPIQTNFIFLLFFCCFLSINAQVYQKIPQWDEEINTSIKNYLDSTMSQTGRKVAVFDCDGTLFGQAPYYLADEALFAYAMEHYKGKKDSLSVSKMAIVDSLLHGDNQGTDYVKRRINFLAGLPVSEVETMGMNAYKEKYGQKFYPEMKQFLLNLKEFGFEVWVITASPEVLYQRFVNEELGIPKNRIIGVKSVISNGILTDQLVYPIPQEEGKAKTIETFIKASPMIVGGNSRGDLEMMERSTGIKIIVNPNDQKIYSETNVRELNGKTLKTFWTQHHAIEVPCKDTVNAKTHYVSRAWNVKINSSH